MAQEHSEDIGDLEAKRISAAKFADDAKELSGGKAFR